MGRAESLLQSMTLREKVAQCMQIAYTMVSKEEAKEWIRRGAGSFLNVLGKDAQELKEYAAREGKIPLIFGIDAIHGHCLKKGATVFPTQLSMACTFDSALAEEIAAATAAEVAADGLHWTFSPVFCLARDLRWGRVGETFGEDAYLSGELGAAMVRGYQGRKLSEDTSILACAKHFIGYGESVGARDSCDTEMTYRKMRDCFLPPFEKAVQAGCATVMTAYGSTDGLPCTADKKLLTDILRDELQFKGFVVTDWANLYHIIYRQRIVSDYVEASSVALNAGNDMMMARLEFYDAAVEAFEKGMIEQSVLDEAVRRILLVKEDLGLLDNPFKQAQSVLIGCEKHTALAEESARKSVVLLKNDGILPLRNVKKVALIGVNADDVRCNYGDWTYFTHPQPNLETQPVRPYVTLKEGLESLAKAHGAEVLYHRGYTRGEEEPETEGALGLAKQADAVVFAGGDFITQAGEAKDRADLSLDAVQRKLFAALKATGKPIISVWLTNKPVCAPEIDENSNAVMTNFCGGMFGGQALAEAIFGEINPGGKLPVSWPRHVGQLPVYYNDLGGWHAERYADMEKTPLYVFGHGLSYTDFEYESAFDEETLTLFVTVKNVGTVAGEEVVQVYFRDKVATVMTPVKQLIGFKKICLAAGETKRVEFTFTPKTFSFVRADEKRVTEAGEFEIMVGGSSADEKLQKITFRIDKTAVFA